MDWWLRVRGPSVRVLELGRSPVTRRRPSSNCSPAHASRTSTWTASIPLPGAPPVHRAARRARRPSTRLPRLLTDLLDQRLIGLSVAGWRVAAVLGAADRALGSAMLENACGLEPEALDAGVRELVDRHLLAPDRSRSSTCGIRCWPKQHADELGPEKSEVHRGLARALDDAGASAAEIAEHWRFAGDRVEELHWRIAAAWTQPPGSRAHGVAPVATRVRAVGRRDREKGPTPGGVRGAALQASSRRPTAET